MSKSLRETLIDKYGEDILSHPVFGDRHEMAHQVKREHMFGEQTFGPESEQTFAREVAGSERAGQFIIDGGGKESPTTLA
jgi:hypothetical protein